MTDFWPKLLWNIKWIRDKVSFEASSCSATESFPSKSIKNSVSKIKKCVQYLIDPPLPSECHVLFEWPLGRIQVRACFFLFVFSFLLTTKNQRNFFFSAPFHSAPLCIRQIVIKWNNCVSAVDFCTFRSHYCTRQSYIMKFCPKKTRIVLKS